MQGFLSPLRQSFCSAAEGRSLCEVWISKVSYWCYRFCCVRSVCLSKPWGFVLYWLESALFYPQEGRGHGVQLGELPQGASTSAAERDSIKAPREPLPVPLLPKGKLPCWLLITEFSKFGSKQKQKSQMDKFVLCIFKNKYQILDVT